MLLEVELQKQEQERAEVLLAKRAKVQAAELRRNERIRREAEAEAGAEARTGAEPCRLPTRVRPTRQRRKVIYTE
jgi:hypothetical protein